MASFGSAAMDIFFNTVREGGYILCVEGAVSTRDNGIYNIIGYHDGRAVTGLEAVLAASGNAEHVVAVGACACYGGPSAAPPNPSGSKSVYDVLEGKAIRMPACPCSGDWIASLLVSLIENKPVELDSQNRPVYLYGITIHDRCERRSFFEKGIFAQRLGDQGCMLRLGCRGPSTKAPCPITRWNDFINWPVGNNTPCIGCAKPQFPEFNFFTREGSEDE